MHLHSLTAGRTRLRSEDAWGSGDYGAPRGSRRHRGIDLVVSPGEIILSPMDAVVVREAAPYEDDAAYRGLLLRGLGEWIGYELKMFYLVPTAAGTLRAGDPLGLAQDISLKYPGITNHIHLELWHQGRTIDPTPFLT